jgi:transforming growth factor-beta-induced protein
MRLRATSSLISLLLTLSGCQLIVEFDRSRIVDDAGTDAETSDAPTLDAGTDAPIAVDAPTAMDAPMADDAPMGTDAPMADDAPMGTDAPTGTDAPMADAGPDAPASPDAPTSPPSLGDLVSGDPQFSILRALVERAELLGTLSAPLADLTVFAPTDAAFAASGLTLSAVEALDRLAAADILLYHVLDGTFPAAGLSSGPVNAFTNLTLCLDTTSGVRLNGGNPVSGGAHVVTADVAASNGVLHVIDRVLLRPTVQRLAAYCGLTTLDTAVTDAGLADELAATGPFTVFGPTNAAFAALASLPTGAALEQALLYHVVAGSLGSSSIPARADSLASNAWGNGLTLIFDTSSGVLINGGAQVMTADLAATNGTVHVIDEVLLPMNVLQAAEALGLSGVIGAVNAAADIPGPPPLSVADALAADAPYTVFAPNNAAFAAISATLATLTAEQVRDVLLYHVLNTTTFPAPVRSSSLPSAAVTLGTLNAANDIPFLPGPPPTVDGAGLLVTDVNVTNGVVHVIDAVMVPATL